MKKPAQTQRGFANPILIGIGGLVLLAIILYATGALKFSGSIKYTPSSPGTSGQTSTEAPKINLSETYTHSSPAYSIKYPGNWGIFQSGKAVALFSKEGGATKTEQSEAGIIITTSALGKLAGSKLSTIADLSRPQIKDEFPGSTISSEEDIKVGSYDAHVYNMVYPNKGADWQAKFYVLVDKENLYGLVAAANKPLWSKYETTLQAIVNSLKLPQ